MSYFVLTVELSFGEWKEYLSFNIEAQDRQMVKYHYHYTLKDWGFSDTQFGKHCLENWTNGIVEDIHKIEKVSPHEYTILDEYMYEFPKTKEY